MSNNLSFQHQASEYLKCAKDPAYFFAKYCIVQHPIKGEILFDPFEFQQDTLNDFLTKRLNIVLKSRQMGLSTLCALLSLWLMTFKKGQQILIIATKLKVATNIIRKVELAHRRLPSFLKLEALENSKTAIGFVNGSLVKAESATEDAGRSESISLLIIDEMAWIGADRVDTIWSSAQSTITTGGKCIILSTPNGSGNLFHQIWVNSKLFGFNKIYLPWNLHPERDEEWRKRQDFEQGDPRKAAQEYDCSFEVSMNAVISSEILNFYRTYSVKEPIEQRYGGQLLIWELPIENEVYVIGADVARGDGGDCSAFPVLKASNLEQVAEFKGKVGTIEYARILNAVGQEYNSALLAVENASIGWAVLDRLIQDLKYPNLYHAYKGEMSLDEQILISAAVANRKESVPGFTTSAASRPLIIDKMVRLINSKSLPIRSERLLDELTVFIWLNGKAQAKAKYNDDLVLSYAITLWVRDTAIRAAEVGRSWTTTLINGISKTNNSDPFLVPAHTSNYSKGQQNPWVQEQHGEIIDLREWL